MTIATYATGLQGLRTTPSAPIPGRATEMLANHAGGYGFTLDPWTILDRFLLLGTIGGTYYQGEATLTQEIGAILRPLAVADGPRMLARILEISHSGRAVKNAPAVAALALLAKTASTDAVRNSAYRALPEVCRTGTDLFAFAEMLEALGGWSAGARRAVARWYARDEDQVAYQVVKYRQRNGWTHQDLLRLAHPKATPLLGWVAGKTDQGDALPLMIVGFEQLQAATSPRQAANCIRAYNLPREAVPTQFLADPEVLEALLEKMPLTALIRNLGNLTEKGVIAPFSVATQKVIADLADHERLRAARVHPMTILTALRTYQAGHGLRGKSSWSPVQQVCDTLDAAFYRAMEFVVPTYKRLLLAVDVSASMRGRAGNFPDVAGVPMAPAEAAAAMALLAARTEPNHFLMGFGTEPHELKISPHMRLDAALQIIQKQMAKSRGTNCAVPAEWALRENLNVDGLVIFTDNETWAGSSHPAQAVAAYRRKINPDLRVVCAAFSATPTSVADQADPLSINCVGLDAGTPEVIRGFLCAEI